MTCREEAEPDAKPQAEVAARPADAVNARFRATFFRGQRLTLQGPCFAMKPTLKNLLIAFIVAVPVAFIVLPYSFELLATILFGGLFLLVTAYDYGHASRANRVAGWGRALPARSTVLRNRWMSERGSDTGADDMSGGS